MSFRLAALLLASAVVTAAPARADELLGLLASELVRIDTDSLTATVVGRTGFEQQYAGRRTCAQTVGKDTTRRARANDDVVE